MAKRLNMLKEWDKICAGPLPGSKEEVGVAMIRTATRVALDDEHDQYGPMARFLIDHMMGRATQKVEVSVPQGIQLDMSGAALTMMGLKSVTGTYTDEDGESNDLTVRPQQEPNE